MRVYLCGVRGSTPAPGPDFLRYGGHTPCVAISRDDHEHPSLILDAGTGIREATALMRGDAFQGTILLTHLHWDHVQGLPFFAAGDDERARGTVLLPEQEDGARAEAVLERAMSPPHFPTTPSQLRGSWRFDSLSPGATELEGLTVLAREIPHKGGRTYGYRISDGHSTLAYMPDHCPTVLGAGEDGYGAYHETAIELAAGTDALVHDAQLFGAAELARESRFGHAVADYAVALGRRAGGRRTVLFHHRPDRTDAQLDELAACFAGTEDIIVAVQGKVLEL